MVLPVSRGVGFCFEMKKRKVEVEKEEEEEKRKKKRCAIEEIEVFRSTLLSFHPEPVVIVLLFIRRVLYP